MQGGITSNSPYTTICDSGQERFSALTFDFCQILSWPLTLFHLFSQNFHALLYSHMLWPSTKNVWPLSFTLKLRGLVHWPVVWPQSQIIVQKVLEWHPFENVLFQWVRTNIKKNLIGKLLCFEKKNKNKKTINYNILPAVNTNMILKHC